MTLRFLKTYTEIAAIFTFQTLPCGAQRIPDLLSLKKRVGFCSHIAIYKPSLKIYHHYLVKEMKVNSIVIIHNVDISNYILSSGFGHIHEDEIKFSTEQPYRDQFESDHLDFEAGVYLIERNGYPTSTDEKVKVSERAFDRRVEIDLKFSSSYSEWFVLWALTGLDECARMEIGVGNISTFGGGVGGAVIGQMLIPVPIVGGMLGGIVGGWLGRKTGKLHDHQQEENRKQALIDKAAAKQYNEQGEAS